MKKYQIICENCKATRSVGILESTIDWLDNLPDPQMVKIISGRHRIDSQWGWQCVCGNNDLLTDQEIKNISNPSNPKPQELSTIAKNLIPQTPRFKMEVV